MDKSRFFNEILPEYEESLREGRKCFLEPDDYLDIYYYYQDNRKDLDAAICLKNALCLYPNHTNLLITKAYELLDQRKVNEALMIVKNIDDQDANDVLMFNFELSLLRGDFDTSKEYLERLKQNIPYNEDFVLEIAEVYLDCSYYHMALRWLKENDRNFENKSKQYFQFYAEAFFQIRNFSKAERFVNKAIDIDPYDEALWLLLCETQLKEGFYEKAIESSDYALTINAESIPAIRFKIEALQAIGTPEEISKIIEECPFKADFDYTIYRWATLSYFKHKRRKEPLEYASKAFLLCPKGSAEYNDVTFCYAICLYEQDRYDEAIDVAFTLLEDPRYTASSIIDTMLMFAIEGHDCILQLLLIDELLMTADYNAKEYGHKILLMLSPLSYFPEIYFFGVLYKKTPNEVWNHFLDDKYDPDDLDMAKICHKAWELKHRNFQKIFQQAFVVNAEAVLDYFREEFPDFTDREILDYLIHFGNEC